MQLLTQKTIAKSANREISLLCILGEIGGQHHLILLDRQEGRIVEAIDDTPEARTLLMGEFTEPFETHSDIAPNCPVVQVRSRWQAMPDGTLAIELIREKTILHRDPAGNWRVLLKEEISNANAVGRASAPTNSAAVALYDPAALIL